MKKPIIAALSAVIVCMLCYLMYVHIAEQKGSLKSENEKENGIPGSGADKSLNSWWLSKAYPDPTNITGKYLRGWEQAKEIKRNTDLLFNRNNSRTTGFGTWTAFGPKVFGGRILSLAINPVLHTDGSRTIFAGSASGGIWKSYTDGVGATAWQPVNTGLPVLGVASIVYKPGDTTVLLAGTGEVYRVENYTSGPSSSNQVANIGRNVWKARGTYGFGILRSTNGGITWNTTLLKDTSDLFGVQRIRFDPNNSNIVYACGTDSLYKSADAGATWAPIWPKASVSPGFVSDVIIDPDNSQVMVLGVGNVNNSNKGIWKTTNGGTTWTQILAGAYPSAAKSGYRGSTRFEVGNRDTLYASIGMNDLGSGFNVENEIFRSLDFGSTWTMVTGSNHASFQSWYSHVVMPYPNNASKLFVAGVKKHVLTLSGVTKTTGTKANIGTGSSSSSYLTPGMNEGTNYLHDDVHDVQFVPGSSTVAYFATDGGIFRTVNADASPATNMTFTSCNGGLQVAQFYPSIAQSKTGTTVIGGLQDNNVIRYNGAGWAKVIGGDGAACLFKPDDESIVLAGNDTRGFNRSTDNGITYPGSPLDYLGSITTPNDDRTAFVAPVAVSPANSNRWYVGSDNIHISTDAGATFTDAGVPGTNYIEAFHKPAIAIGVSPSNANKLFVSVSPFAQDITNDAIHYNPPANIRKSINGGSSFTTVTATLPDRFVTDFAISATNDDSVFVTLSGFGTTHVYVTGNGGTTWVPRGNGLPDVPFNTILQDPVNANIIYAGCDFGIYVSPDRGVNWYDFNNGMWDATYVMDLVTTTQAGVRRIRAVTHGKGIFESPLFTLNILPVNIVSFTGNEVGTANQLKWNVEAEDDMKGYELERSANGSNFKTIASVAIHSSNPQYHYNDILQDRISYYYRLKAINKDGSYKYSEVIFIKRQTKETFQLMGNPFKNSMQVKVYADTRSKLSLQMYDMKGRLVKKEEVNVGPGLMNYPVYGMQSLSSGMYILEAVLNEQRWTQKVIKE